ncbi:LuxR C-terminal-related transcriptional regulator [Streptomyces sp. NPDC046909]|uniref:LuxR C-terminal-related transcriptional regulator n=1 Tax=Streptomyces sp. NPDC046909 TaxID=3155617 RepID=UPI00340EFA69
MNHDDAVPELDELAVAVYREILKDGRYDDEDCAKAQDVPVEQVRGASALLESLKVIEPVAGREGEWRAVHPELAAGNAIATMETHSRRLAARAERLRAQIRLLTPVYTHGRHPDEGPAVETVIDPDTVHELIASEAEKCTEEVLSLQPGGGRPVPRLAQAQARDLALLRRGVRLRSVYQHASRYDLPTAGYVDTLSAIGGEFRTVEELPDRMLVFDRRTCFLPIRPTADDRPEDDPIPPGGQAAAVIRQPSVVAFLVGMFSIIWDQAQPFEPSTPQPEHISEQVKLAILRIMATGAKDEVVARRLGFSVRTCRRHISDLMQSLGADSRFQAGVVAQSLGLVNSRTEP